MYEWVLIFVVQTSLGAAPLSGAPVIRYKTYAACKATAEKFNGSVGRSGVMQQRHLAVCESLGDQKRDDDASAHR